MNVLLYSLEQPRCLAAASRRRTDSVPKTRLCSRILVTVSHGPFLVG